jgi:hypothetical protein
MLVSLLFLLANLNTSTPPPASLIETKHSGNVCSAGAPDFRESQRCRPTDQAEFAADPQSYFLWRSDKGAVVWLGRAEQESRLAFDASEAALISLRVRQAAPDLTKQQTTLTLKSLSGAVWIVPFTSEKLQQLRLLALPAGQFELIIRTPGYPTTVKRGLDARRGKVLELSPINIEHLPTITGVVHDYHTGEPIPGAEIRSGDTTTFSDSAGRFSLNTSSATQEISLVASATNYASQEIIVHSGRKAVAPQQFLLTRGGSLRFIVQHECVDDCAATTRLFMRREMATFSDPWRLVAQKSGAGKNIDYRFDALVEGRYAVIVEGQSPLERSVSYLTLGRDEKKEQAIRLNDIRLKGVVTLGDLPLAKANLTLSTDEELWSGNVHTDANGEYSVRLWQGGTWGLTIDVPTERRQPFFSIRNLNDDADQSWDIAIPTRAITGRVFDRRTMEAIVGAEVVDHVVPHAPGKILSTTDQDGRFRLPMLPAGTHTISVQSEGFVSSEPINVQLTEADAQREVPIALDRARRVFFRVANAAGEPAPNITVYDWVGALGLENRAPYWSDAWGLVSVPILQGEQKPIYVMDQSGSFSVALADSATKTSAETPIKITLPPPVAALTLLATTKSGPAAGMRFLVRFDGRFLPPRIWDLVTGSLSRVALTGQDGRLTIPSLPVGTYEFWSYQTVDELRDLFTSVYTRPPTRVVLSPGPNTIKIDVDGAH